MDYNPDAAANNPWWYYHNDGGGAAPVPSAAAATSDAGDTSSSFQFGDMIAENSTDDLFELVWGQGGGGSRAAGGAPAVSCLCSPRFDPPPPSEGEMAAWLREIDQANDGGHRREPMAVAADDSQPAEKGSTGDNRNKKEKLPRVREGTIRTSKEMRKPPAGGSSSRRSHHGEAHNLTEKRRRHKINERLKALQQIVPGCDESNNQTSTLDRTIRYIKSLQDQVQAMSVGPAAVYPVPVVPPRFVPPGPGAPVAMPTIPAAAPVVLAAGHHHTPTTVPFSAMLHVPYYPAAVAMPAAADAAPLYPYPAAAAPPRDAVVVASGAGDAAMSAGRPPSSARIKQQRSS